MSELVEQKRRQWRSGAIRQLLELETLAKELRDRLESGEVDLVELVHESSDINSCAMTFTTYVDRSVALEEAGIQ